MNLADFELSQTAQHWANTLLIWLGLGILAGLLAKFILPGRRPEGAAGTLLIGLVGSTLGPGILSACLRQPNFNPISPLGMFAAVGGSVAALVGYRLFVLWRLGRDEDEEALE